MLKDEQVEMLIAQYQAELRLPLNAGDRLSVASDTVAAVIRRLAPIVTMAPPTPEEEKKPGDPPPDPAGEPRPIGEPDPGAAGEQ